MKRAVDVVLAAAALVVTAPLAAAMAVAVRATSPGPVLHRGRRVGRDDRPITVYKFRSMVVDAENLGPGITSGHDPRVTRVGRLLRATKLDELPQLWNVVAGDMSLVGPRPEDPRYVASYTSEQRRILAFRPGLTSPASLAYRHEEALLAAAPDAEALYRERVLPDKLAIDLAYFPTATLRSDVRIMLQTIRALGTREPAVR